jgi:anti-sigma regulatory factor (Ser/Thr protein kinase)
MAGERRVVLEARGECLEEAVRFIAEELADAACPEEKQQLIELALEELFINVARYAYGRSGGGVRQLA